LFSGNRPPVRLRSRERGSCMILRGKIDER
jgi:hypothetical protein